MTRRRPPYFRLHQEFVDAVRARYRADMPLINSCRDLRHAPWYRHEAIYAGTDSRYVVAREGSPEFRRLRKLADAIGYGGPILGEGCEPQ